MSVDAVVKDAAEANEGNEKSGAGEDHAPGFIGCGELLYG